MTIALLGLEQCLARFAAFEAIAHKVGGEIIENGAEVVIDEMKARAPVLTGELRDSIRVVDTDTGLDESSVSVGATVEYDMFVQFGTTYMAAQPYGEEAAEAAADAVFGAAVSSVRSGFG